MLQRIAVFQMTGASDNNDELSESDLSALAERIAVEDVQLFYQTALLGRRDLYLAPDPRSGTEMTLLRMLAFQPGSAAGGRDTEAIPVKAKPGTGPTQSQITRCRCTECSAY